MKKGLYRLEVYYKQSATESEKEVLRFLINQTREAVEMDIHTMAKKCFCSPATIVRICKKNGFSGFKELKQALWNDMNFSKQLMQVNLDAPSGEKIPNIVANVLNTNIMAIQNIYNLLDFDELDRIVALLLSQRYVYLYGIGASFLVAKDFQQKLERINKRTFLYEDIHLQLISSTNLEPGDVAIIVSYSGITKEIIEIAQNVKMCGGKIIAITKYGTNKLSSMSDFNLFVPMLEKPLRVGASSSRVSQLSVVDIVYNTYISLEKDKSMEKILSTNKLLEKKEDE
ncbi:MAG: MurR/RpiR family transcriptional regulator [Lachnospiraceae bacterium]|jgi:RpiR family murPQ operon transcriptional repressor|nr:MurR/RpiR family transcriptional regulator [Lachnospiraceae bacterium]MCI9107114.1 MurR/RpiR family transcriptional regulator [Lachnospiraceae bacterium]MCI9342014.1 MurR/RpiR family transcriptional regulator [Lachnospiraceae bacterium]